MAFRLYIVPAITVGKITQPKYINTDTESYTSMPYGFQPTFLVGGNLSAGADTTLSGAADVYSFPADISGNVGGGNVQAARNALEAAFIPAQGINAQDTWTSVVRRVAGMFSYMDRLHGILKNYSVLVDSTAKLNTPYGSLPQDVQDGIIAAAKSFVPPLDTAFIVANTQLRTIINTFADSWQEKVFFFNGGNV